MRRDSVIADTIAGQIGKISPMAAALQKAQFVEASEKFQDTNLAFQAFNQKIYMIADNVKEEMKGKPLLPARAVLPALCTYVLGYVGVS